MTRDRLIEMKCTICGRETGASWRRYCYPHWKQYGRGRRSYSAPLAVGRIRTELTAPIQRKPPLRETILGWVFGVGVLGAIIGLPLGVAVFRGGGEELTTTRRQR